MKINLKSIISRCIFEANMKVSNWDNLLSATPLLNSGVELLKQIESLGGQSYIVGGAARDIMMGSKIKDIDIATNVPMETLKSKFKWNAIGQSQDFGIIMIHFDGAEFEVASFRSEEGSSDSRHPNSVEMTQSFETDSKRRDFTINSMGIDSSGELVDYQNGLEDLKNNLIRAVGNPKNRFQEDALRILRALRFAVRYGFKIESETKTAMAELGHLISKLSSERISDELLKVAVNGKQLSAYIQHLDEIGLLDIILPELKRLQGKEQNPKHHPEGDSFIHSLRAVECSRSMDPVVNIAILFHDLGKGTVLSEPKNGHPTYYGHDAESVNAIKQIAIRLKWSSKLADTVAFAAANHMKAHNFNKLNKKTIYQLITNPNWHALKEVLYADFMARGDIPEDNTLANIAYGERIAKDMDSASTEGKSMTDALKAKVNGQLVMKITGLKAGKELGDILKAVQDWIYEAGIENVSDQDVIDKIMEFKHESKY